LPRSQVEQTDHEWGISPAEMIWILEIDNAVWAEAIQTIEEENVVSKQRPLKWFLLP
jgi:hypothetical protein